MKPLVFSILFLALFFVYSSAPSYARVLPQSQKSKTTQTIKPGGSAVTLYPRLRPDRRALFLTFRNAHNASSIFYNLTYLTNGREEGVGGSVSPSEGKTVTREMLFGTCSKNDCSYHTGITNMRLEVTIELPSGKKFIKRYKIKV